MPQLIEVNLFCNHDKASLGEVTEFARILNRKAPVPIKASAASLNWLIEIGNDLAMIIDGVADFKIGLSSGYKYAAEFKQHRHNAIISRLTIVGVTSSTSVLDSEPDYLLVPISNDLFKQYGDSDEELKLIYHPKTGAVTAASSARG